MSFVGAEQKASIKHSNRADPKIKNRLAEDIGKVSFDLIVVANWADHKKFSPFGA